jgi:hypothetical protein
MNVGGATILLSGKGWREGATEVFLCSLHSYIGMALSINAKLLMLSLVEAVHTISILFDIYDYIPFLTPPYVIKICLNSLED